MRLIPGFMRPSVTLHIAACGERPAAYLTRVWFLAGVDTVVLGQIAAGQKFLLAHLALVRLDAGVRQIMRIQT